MKKITSAGPSITASEIEWVTEAVREGWQDKMSWYIDRFAQEFAEYVGVEYCLPTAHCTDAVHLALLSLGIGAGDEVVVPDLTWVASAAPIVYVGAKPVFADVDPVSWCVSAESVERCLTPKTKALVAVDLLGNMPEWKEIVEICEKNHVEIIEDAAEGLGATYEGKKAGTFGRVGLFSFNATKLIMSGQGGAFCTDDKTLYEKAKLHSHHGIDKSLTGKYYWSTAIGHNYNWTNIQAALALSQLRRIEELIGYKRDLYRSYAKGLAGIEGIRLSPSKPNVDPTYWITVAVWDKKFGVDKEELVARFSRKNIDLRPLFYPVSAMPPFRKYLPETAMEKINPVSYHLSNYGVCLPNGNNLNSEDIERVVESLINELT